MKISTIVCVAVSFIVCCLYSPHFASAQQPLDRFLSGTPVSTVIGTSVLGELVRPVDLDFCQVPGRTHELWVLNRDSASGSSMSIYYHAGTPTETREKRKDSHRGHFMVNCPAFAMADTGDFATVQEVQNSTGEHHSTFMGPVLWNSDTSIFARMYQSDWVSTEPLGSHIDMLHQSPFSMGIAFDKANVFWVFDGYAGNLCRYNFEAPHEIGGDDHSDGRVRRFPEIALTRIADLPAHMVIDHKTGWLYIVDNFKKRIIRMDINSGVKDKDLPPYGEDLPEYISMKNVKWEAFITTGLVKPCGIDFMDGRLIVSDNSNGDIIIYSTDSTKGIELGRIKTGFPGIAGVKIGPDSNIWYVNTTRNEAVRLAPDKKPLAPMLTSPANNALAIALDDTLEWLPAIGGALTYRVQLSNNNSFLSSLIIDSVIPSLRIPLENLSRSTAYYWRVEASNTDGTSAWSTVWKFTTVDPAPAITMLVSPADQSTNMNDAVTLVWAQSPFASSYHVQLSSDQTFATTHSDTTLAGFSLLASKLAPNVSYYWRVQAKGDGGVAPWSDTWKFERNSLDVKLLASATGSLAPIYPNPAATVVTINFSVTEPTPVKLEMYNNNGVLVKTVFNALAQAGATDITVSLNDVSDGIYYVRLQTPAQTLERMIVVVAK